MEVKHFKMPNGSTVNLPEGGYKLVASVETEEETSKIEISGFEGNEAIVVFSIKATGSSMQSILCTNGGWATSDIYVSLIQNVPTDYYFTSYAIVFAAEGNAFAKAYDSRTTIDNSNYQKITSIVLNKVGSANYAQGCKVYVYAR